MAWTVGFLEEEVKVSLDALPLDIRASFQRISELMQAHGLERVREPYGKHLEGPLWENADERQERHCTGLLRHRRGQADRCRSRLREEDSKDAST